MNLNGIIKKLIALGAIFGGKAKKLSGIPDKNNYVTDLNLVIDSITKTITLTSTAPSFLTVGKLFRVKNGGGANQDQLFKVLSISSNVITCDITAPYFDPINYVGAAKIDGRIWICINDTNIAKDSVDGNTIFNIDNTTSTGLPDGSGIAQNSVGHYHDAAIIDELDNIKFDYIHMGG